ncbi:MAG: DUF2750 domain-containing protein [Fibrobacterota bacterium]|nr:DUF2750 domain-containing protein [Fibrobacterota bacterium]
MSNPSAASDPFFTEATATRKIYAFLSEGQHLVFEIGSKEAVPFWSSRNRIKTIQKANPDFGPYEVKEYPLDYFSGIVLPSLQEAGVWVGSNWDGRPPEGFVYPSDEFGALIEAAKPA